MLAFTQAITMSAGTTLVFAGGGLGAQLTPAPKWATAGQVDIKKRMRCGANKSFAAVLWNKAHIYSAYVFGAMFILYPPYFFLHYLVDS